MLHAAGAVLEQPWNTPFKNIVRRRITTDSAGNYSTNVRLYFAFACVWMQNMGAQLAVLTSRRSETISRSIAGVPTFPVQMT